MKWEIIALVLGVLVLWKAGYIRRELTLFTASLSDRYEKIANSLGVLLLVIIFLVTVYSAKVIVSPIYCMVMGEDVSCLECDPHDWPCDIPLP